MFGDLIVRFFIGGAVVSLFSAMGDTVRPKLVAGIFGAAPSVALATLGLAFAKQGAGYAATEGRSMMLGACALACYSVATSALLARRVGAMWAALLAWAVWLVVAVGGWAVVLRS